MNESALWKWSCSYRATWFVYHPRFASERRSLGFINYGPGLSRAQGGAALRKSRKALQRGRRALPRGGAWKRQSRAAIMCVAAGRAGIHGRQLSFTYADNIVQDGIAGVLPAATFDQEIEAMGRLMDLVARCKLPNPAKRRSFAREVWRHRARGGCGRGYRSLLRVRRIRLRIRVIREDSIP
jgi:hypothetical protein